eukprot:m.70436 g.70436  ORF g.70436 m.70436 type:complete len:187 (-) comp7878_c1_seq1:2202-2762(-)
MADLPYDALQGSYKREPNYEPVVRPNAGASYYSSIGGEENSTYHYAESPIKPPLPADADYLVPVTFKHSLYDDPRAMGQYAEPVRQGVVQVSPILSRADSEDILRRAGLETGQFVLRPSQSHRGSYVLCVAAGGTIKHYPIELQPSNEYIVLCPGVRRTFVSLREIIDYYQANMGGIACTLSERVG